MFSPAAPFSCWARILRMAMTSGKNELGAAEVEQVNHSSHPQKGTVNTLLVVACVVFGAASFIFGYDDKVISPIIALPAFVSAVLVQ